MSQFRRAGCAFLVVAFALPASSQVLLDEPFASTDALGAWAMTVGATSGPGRESTVAWDDGAVRFDGDDDTRIWWALSRQLSVDGAGWLRVTGRVRVADVDPTGSPSPYCYLLVRHSEGLVATRVLAGTVDWTTLRRRVELPAGTTQVDVMLFLGMPGRAWFDDVRVEAVADPGWTESVAGHYRYLTLPGDEIPAEARAFNEASYDLVSDFFGLPADARQVTYIKYPDLDAIEEYTGIRGNARRQGDVIHTIWATDRHEIVHVLGDALGDPPALLAEGLAVYLSGGWQGRPVRVVAAELVASGEWVPPSTLFTSAAFRAHSDLVTYPLAGAWVAWLVDVHGREAVRLLYGALQNAAPEADNRARFGDVLGVTPGDTDQAVLDWLR